MTPRSVLVADDNLTIQRMASEMLSQEGLEVTTVANGMAAIKKLPALRPLVVMADVDMPGKDGYEVCEFVKSQPDLHYIRVLLVVSDTDPYDHERGSLMQVDGVIKKPFDRQELVSVVMKCVDQAQALRPSPPETIQDEANHAPWDVHLEPNEEPAPPAEATDSTPSADTHPAFTSTPAAIFSEPEAAGLSILYPDHSGPPEVDWPVGLSPIPLAEEHFESPGLSQEASPPNLPDPVTTMPVEWQGESVAEPAAATDFPEPAISEVHFSQPLATSSEGAGLVATPPAVTNATDFPPAPFVPEPAAPVEAAREDVSPAPQPDLSLVTSVIHAVVSRMAPPALSPELVQGLEQRLKDEIISEIKSSRE